MCIRDSVSAGDVTFFVKSIGAKPPRIPSVGIAHASTNYVPVIGPQGPRGPRGIEGDDGDGIEYVFTSTAASVTSIVLSKRPSNGWGYEIQGTRDSQVWSDGAPTLTSSKPLLWRSQRKVPGSPSAGTTVTDNWTIPVIVGRYGIDGNDGIPTNNNRNRPIIRDCSTCRWTSWNFTLRSPQ